MGRSKRKRRGFQPPRRTSDGEGVAMASSLASPLAPGLELEDAAAPTPETRRGLRWELAHALQAEDVILFGWIVLASRLAETRFGALLHGPSGLAIPTAWIYGMVLVGLAIVFYTRGPADTDLNEATSRRCVLGLSGWFAARSYFAGDPNWLGRAFVVVFAVAVLASPLNNLEKLPRTSLGLRRVLVLPATLVGNSVFSALITPDFLRGAELQGVPAEYRLFAAGLLAAFLFLYVVVGPRVMAGEDWRPLSWIVRLGFYLVAVWLGKPSWLQYGW
jgi:hypothetical protein